MPKEQPSEPEVLEFLASQVMGAKEKRETLESKLERVPRWRFKRRAELERLAERNRKREQAMLGLVRDS